MYEGVALNYEKEADGIRQSDKPDPYLPGPALIKAVQLAQILQRPLLLKGEPGCGKSRLAEAVAYELFGDSFRDYYFQWHVKSSSKAQDGLFTIDYLKRMSNANIKNGNKNVDIRLAKDDNGNYKDKSEYVTLGELGKAFQLTQRMSEKSFSSPPVILIDEIDKADIDFPNDLLLELDKMEFTIPEAKDENGDPVQIKANPKFRPLIFITSNDEKTLPPAFLRRCLFHYIDFKEIPLKEIVKTNYARLPAEFISDAVDQFISWREKIDKTGISNKNITTSELLDWIKIINYYHDTEHKVPEFVKNEMPPYYSALLKDPESIKLFVSPSTTIDQNVPAAIV